jgi:hypothetical protein
VAARDRSLLQQADGLLQRHGQQELLLEAAGVLVHASRTGPAALQARCCVLKWCDVV